MAGPMIRRSIGWSRLVARKRNRDVPTIWASRGLNMTSRVKGIFGSWRVRRILRLRFLGRFGRIGYWMLWRDVNCDGGI